MESSLNVVNSNYKSSKIIWDARSSVRSKPRILIHNINDHDNYYFPISRQPIAEHPIIKEKGEKAKEFILLQSCYKFMHDVAMIETEVVNAGALIVANNKLQHKFSKSLQLDAFSVIIDEAYHAYVAFDFLEQLIEKTGIEPVSMPKANPVISALKTIQNKLPEDIRDIFTVIAVCIGEHVLIKDVIDTSKGKSVINEFINLMSDHVSDEGRHSQIFSYVMKELWVNLSDEIKNIIGPLLIEYFKLNFSLDAQKDFECRVLQKLNLSHNEINKIMSDIYPNTFNDGINLQNPIIANIIKMLNRCDVFKHKLTRDAFFENKLISNGSVARSCDVVIKPYIKFEKSISGGLIFSIPSQLSAHIYKSLYDLPYSQEEEPNKLAEIAKDIIYRNINENEMLKNSIKNFTYFASPPYILLRNFIDIENIPQTPIDDSLPPIEKWRHVAGALLGVMLLSDHRAASFQDEMNGRLSHMVMPAKNSEDSYVRSTKRLDFHTEVLDGLFQEEIVFSGPPVAPDILGLICLRNIEKAATTVLSLEELLKKLPPEIIDDLMQPYFTTSSQSYSERKVINPNISLIKKLDKGYLGIRYSHHRLKSNNEIGRRALEYLKNTVENSEQSERLILQPGDILLINNRTCLHGRDSLVPSANFDGLDRWLIRMYGYNEASLMKILKSKQCDHVMRVE